MANNKSLLSPEEEDDVAPSWPVRAGINHQTVGEITSKQGTPKLVIYYNTTIITVNSCLRDVAWLIEPLHGTTAHNDR